MTRQFHPLLIVATTTALISTVVALLVPGVAIDLDGERVVIGAGLIALVSIELGIRRRGFGRPDPTSSVDL